MSTIGIVLGDRFDLRRQVGMGAMGVVYEAWDRETEHAVAVKVLRGDSRRSAQRFVREATILAELDHPAIVRYVTHGTSPHGETYLVMEWLEGKTLESRLGAGPLSVEDALALARRVIDGLAVAHQRGVVHRDLKPSNIFLPSGAPGDAKILDFGIAWRIWDEQRLTQTGAVLGTPLYMAPEQARGDERIDPRADLYSLGAVLLECLTGEPPFSGANAMAILCKICLEEPPRLATILAGVPRELDAVLRSMLAKNPASRPRDALSLATQLAAISANGEAAVVIEKPSVALTEGEQRVFCAIFVSAPAPSPTDAPSAITLTVPTLDEVKSNDAILDVVAEYGARQEHLIDGSMAITFSGLASTDQAVAAGRCALVLRELLPHLLMVVCTGRGTIYGRTPIGDVIDRGAGLLETSRPGEIRLDAPTAGLLDARFVVEGAEPELYLRAERELDETPRTVLGKAITCLGREPELALLDGIFETTIDSEAHAVLVTGVAGAGKSRLRQEFVHRLEKRGRKVQLVIGRADSVRTGSPFALVASSVRWTAGISGHDSVESRRQKLQASVARFLPLEQRARVTDFLGELTGISFSGDPSAALRAARQDARLMGDQIRTAWLEWLQAQCSKEPVLMVLEDLHWSDAQSVQLVDSALTALRERPLMVLALARPEVSTRFERLWEEHGLQTFPLSPLSRRTCEKLVAGVLGHARNPELTQRIVEQSDGNPFFLEELVRAVAVGQTELPETVLGMVQSRLDALGAESGRVLRAASVFGEIFSLQGVRSLVGPAASSDLEELLQGLVKREVIVRRASGPNEYAFRHALVREASYATLTEGDRVLGHRLAGEWLERAGETDPMVLADHFDRGGVRERAASWYARSAGHALQGNDLEAAIERAERARACGAVGETLSESEIVAAQAHYWRGEFSAAVASASRAVDHAPMATAHWFHGVRELISPLAELGLVDEVVSWSIKANEAVPTTPEEAEAQVACLSWCAGALANTAMGELAGQLLSRAESTLASMISSDSWVASRLHYAKGLHLISGDDPIQAIHELELGVQAADQAGDVRTASGIRGELGLGLSILGDLEGAESLLRQVIDEARAHAMATIEAFTVPDLASVLIGLGRADEARSALVRGMELAEEKGSPWALGTGHFAFSTLEYVGRDFAAAEHHARQSAEILRYNPAMQSAALAALARALLAQGRSAEAREAAREATDILRDLRTTKYAESLVRLMNAETLRASGDHPGALEAIREARDRLLERAGQIGDPRVRSCFLSNVAENVRTLELATSWGLS